MSPVTCPRCGAHLPEPPLPVCEYCGAETMVKPVPAPLPTPSPMPQEQPASRLPPELSNLKRPKPVRRPIQSIILLLVAIPWTLCSLGGVILMSGGLNREFVTYYSLRDEGQTVHGTVTQLSTSESDNSMSYQVYYRFQAQTNGEPATFDGYDSVSEDVYKQLETGGSVDVIYVRTEPAISAVRAAWEPPDNMFILLVVLFAVFGVGSGVIMALIGIMAVKRLLDLRLRGQLTQAVIFDKWEESDSESSACYVAFAYRIPRFGNKLFTISQQSYHAHKTLQIGDTVSLRYLSENPNISSLVDFWW